jgi:hypothetical protein
MILYVMIFIFGPIKVFYSALWHSSFPSISETEPPHFKHFEGAGTVRSSSSLHFEEVFLNDTTRSSL